MANPRVKGDYQTMNMRMPKPVKALAQQGAQAYGVTLTDFVVAAIAEKMGRDELVPPTLSQEMLRNTA